jgi:uncharacterized phage protein (TIGR01671 family)
MNKHSESTEPSNSTKPVLANRILNFRSWVRNEIMVNVVSIDFNNEFITWDDNQYDRCVPPNKCYEIETFDDIVLMQFTGLKDKKGIEIYEGDIVKLTFSEYYSNDCVTVDEESIAVGIVVFESGGYFINEKDSTWYWLFDMPEVSEIEIIGNIFENPDLLQTTS